MFSVLDNPSNDFRSSVESFFFTSSTIAVGKREASQISLSKRSIAAAVVDP